MSRQRGFTLIEILVVVVIMGILLLLSVVNLRSTQAQARDQERISDVSNIARHFEGLYSSGATSTSGYQGVAGAYPDKSTVDTALSSTDPTTTLGPIDVKNLRAPNVASPTLSLSTATIIGTQAPTASQYIYVPYAFDNTGTEVLCTDTSLSCRRFEIYYRTEVDSIVRKVDSKNQ
jgi:prepilin-type N-terminal cleavage/methylation domain-containing protein